MKNLLFFLGLFICSLPFSETKAQTGSKLCAAGHVNSTARQAAATTGQQKLMGRYDVNYYKLDIAVERTSKYIAGNTLIKASVKQPLDTFAFELHQNLGIDSVKINGQKRVASRTNGFVVVKLPAALATGTPVAAQVYYKGTPPNAPSAAIGEGFSNATSGRWGNQATWSLSQPFAAYEWFAVKQVLTDKADSSEVWVTTSNTNKAGSNGLLKRTVALPNNKVRYEWKSRYPIDYYLISVSVSDYVEYNLYANPAGAPNPVLIQNYIYSNPLTLTTFQNDINDTAPLLVKFSELFTLYPFHKEKYGHSMAPFSGGMEHQTMTTQGLFEFTLTAHELAHQWFGDNVTCGSWRDIWLNEGFASYGEYLALQYLRAGQQRAWMDGTHTSVLSQPGGSLYLPAADSANVARIFDSRLTYDKGAAVVHALRFEMNNDTLFFRTLRRYQTLYKNSTAKTPDFKQVAETISGLNLTKFFNQWVYGEGYPTFSLNWNQVGKTFLLKSTQTVSRGTVTPFFETDVEFLVTRTNGDTTIRVRQTQPVQTFFVHVGGTITGVATDPNQWILNKQGLVAKDNNLTMGTSETVAKAKFLIYPNPATDQIQVKNLPFEPETYRVLDATGRLVKSQSFSMGQKQVDIKGLSKGVYVLRLLRQDKQASVSFRKE